MPKRLCKIRPLSQHAHTLCVGVDCMRKTFRVWLVYRASYQHSRGCISPSMQECNVCALRFTLQRGHTTRINEICTHTTTNNSINHCPLWDRPCIAPSHLQILACEMLCTGSSKGLSYAASEVVLGVCTTGGVLVLVWHVRVHAKLHCCLIRGITCL